MIRNGRYAIHTDWYGHLLQWAGPQFQPKVFPLAAPGSCYRHNGKWVNQPKGGKDVNGGFAIPWRDESLFLMPPIGDCHRMVEKVRWGGGVEASQWCLC